MASDIYDYSDPLPANITEGMESEYRKNKAIEKMFIDARMPSWMNILGPIF